MNRRVMIKSATGAGLGLVVISQVGMQGCSPKNLSVYVQTVVGTLKELTLLLPNSAQFITKAIKIAESFDKAYREGKFNNALSLFSSLSGVLTQIASDAGVNSSSVKVALAIVGMAMRGIAVLLQNQSGAPVVARARANASSEQRAQIALVERLANDASIDRAFAASRL